MLKKSWFLFLIILFLPVSAQAEEIDYPYYQGWVTADGGTTINNEWWMQTSRYGHFIESGTGGYWQLDPDAEAQAIRELDDGYIAIINWYYDTDILGWVLNRGSIFGVDEITLTYYGEYDFEGDSWSEADPHIRFPRAWENGETATFEIGTTQVILSFIRSGVTVPSVVLPSGSSALTDCVLFFQKEDGSGESNITIECCAPGKGYVWNFWYFSTGSTRVETKVEDRVVDWGIGGYPTFMTDGGDNDIGPAVLALNSGVVITHSNTQDIRLTGGSRVVVVPLN